MKGSIPEGSFDHWTGAMTETGISERWQTWKWRDKTTQDKKARWNG